LHREKTRHDNFVWYVRRGKGARVRLWSAFGTPEFQSEYEAALAGQPVVKQRTPSGSLLWLYERYRETSNWRDLSAATRRQRENIFEGVMNAAGIQPYRSITRDIVAKGRDRRHATPSQARNFLDALRGLFRWAMEAGLVNEDPTANVKNPKRPRGEGFAVWTEEEITRYQSLWPTGTRQRVWLDVLLYTGLRRGDAVQLGRQHARNGVILFRTEKTGSEVTLPILLPLQATLAAGPVGELNYICGERGQKLTKESFGNLFREACRQAGIEKSAHGIRKAAATRLAENGASQAELEAIFGWHGGTMASLYTRAADRKRLSLRAMSKMTGTTEQHSIPAPSGEVRALERKS
jgi:integrase